jgi:hypothetical protein
MQYEEPFNTLCDQILEARALAQNLQQDTLIYLLDMAALELAKASPEQGTDDKIAVRPRPKC